MANTLLQLAQSARLKADMEHSQFVKNPELFEYINDAYLELYDLFVGAFQDYFIHQTAPTTIVNASVDVPVDFYKLRAVDLYIDQYKSRTLKQHSFQERNQLNYISPNSYLNNGIKYRLQADKLIFIPAAQAEGKQVVIYYTPEIQKLQLETDTILPALDKFADYISTAAAIQMKIKEESSPAQLEKQLDNIKQRIIKMVPQRDASGPELVSVNNLDDMEWLI